MAGCQRPSEGCASLGSPQLGVQSQLAAQTPKALVLSLQAGLVGPRVAISHAPAPSGGSVVLFVGPGRIFRICGLST